MTNRPNILLIAGSAEAHDIASALSRSTMSAQAILRRVERSFGPLNVPSQIWTPGCSSEMQGYFAANGITAICDAGHGFDADVSLIAAEAARRSGLPYARLVRPTWSIVPPAERAASVAQAAAMIPIGARVFAATGRGTIDDYAPFTGRKLFLRQANAHVRNPLPEFAEAVYGGPPYTQAQEGALFRQLDIDTLVCRNVGGRPSRPKLDAALELGLRAIVIDRPAPPESARQLASPQAALAWLKSL